MPRLFLTPRELDFFSDITKEVMKDIIGQKIFYFSISEVKTQVHDVYNEAPEKIFETPIELDALVEWKSQEITTNQFGSEEFYDITAWVHARDMIDKGVQLSQGDFFSFDSLFFEVVSFTVDDIIYGQVEHKTGFVIKGKQSRRSQFVSKVFGPTDEMFSDPTAVQNEFVQQRGFPANRLGPTGDVRDLQKKGILEKPISGPHEVSEKGTGNSGAAFYGDDD